MTPSIRLPFAVHRRASTLRRVLAWALAAIVLLAVFLAYLQPAMALQLAQQLWSCF